MSVIDIQVLRQTENYRITQCNISLYGNTDENDLERLELKINGLWVFVQNYYHHRDEKDFEEYSQALEIAKTFNPDQGWFKMYGQGTPLDQFKKEFDFKFSETYSEKIKDFDQLQSPGIHTINKISKFSGNHQAVSAAFSFIIWDESLVKQIRKALKTKKEVAA